MAGQWVHEVAFPHWSAQHTRAANMIDKGVQAFFDNTLRGFGIKELAGKLPYIQTADGPAEIAEGYAVILEGMAATLRRAYPKPLVKHSWGDPYQIPVGRKSRTCIVCKSLQTVEPGYEFTDGGFCVPPPHVNAKLLTEGKG